MTPLAGDEKTASARAGRYGRLCISDTSNIKRAQSQDTSTGCAISACNRAICVMVPPLSDPRWHPRKGKRQCLDNNRCFPKYQRVGRSIPQKSRVDALIHGQRPIFRLSPTSLSILGRVLFGPRWKAALHRELGIDERLIHRWATGNRSVSPRQSVKICQAVRAKHHRRADRETATYAAVVDSIVEPEARALLLEIVSKEIEIRVAVIRQLARNGHGQDERPRQSPGGK
jgi:hypothetical protein